MKNQCQSCGMPLKKDPESGGTNADGTKSTKYCSYCFANGAFTTPEIDTPQKMQALVKQKLCETGTPKPVAWLFSQGISRLERWKK